jgi:hypothetical protein
MIDFEKMVEATIKARNQFAGADIYGTLDSFAAELKRGNIHILTISRMRQDGEALIAFADAIDAAVKRIQGRS